MLLAELPHADIDQTLFLCKALAQIGDPRAIEPLLERWKRAPRGAPGTRYIPDALAAIGDPCVVPDLIAPLPRCRFDYRFHVAHALGVLGGPEAEEVLEDLAARDPCPAVREEARRALAKLRE
jgi:HEAT repeat protein